MAFFEEGGGSSGGTIDVPDALRFATTAERDAFFTANPARLRKDVYCTVANQLQRYSGAAWENTAVALKGDKGDDGIIPRWQFSENGESGWIDTLDVAVHKYWRWSIDNGVTWTPNGIRYNAEANVSIATAQDVGVVKPGTTLTITNDGTLEVAISPTGIKFVDDEAARLALPAATGAQIATQGDTGETFGIEAGQDPADPANWTKLGSVALNVQSFNGRMGTVLPGPDDYTHDLVRVTDPNTTRKYVLAVRDGVPGLLEV